MPFPLLPNACPIVARRRFQTQKTEPQWTGHYLMDSYRPDLAVGFSGEKVRSSVRRLYTRLHPGLAKRENSDVTVGVSYKRNPAFFK